MLFTYVSVPGVDWKVWERPVRHYTPEVVNAEEQLKKEQMRMNIFNKGGTLYSLYATPDMRFNSIEVVQGKFKEDNVDSIVQEKGFGWTYCRLLAFD